MSVSEFAIGCNWAHQLVVISKLGGDLVEDVSNFILVFVRSMVNKPIIALFDLWL